MKKVVIVLSLLLLVVGVLGGCGKKRVKLNTRGAGNIAVLTKDGNLKDQTADQVAELDRVIGWMDRDLVKVMKRAGFNPVLIKRKKDYRASMGKLLVVDVDNFNAGNRALRVFVGFGAGAASLDLDYTLYDTRGKRLYRWKDGVGSSKGGTYCAQTLNRNATAKLVEYLN